MERGILENSSVKKWGRNTEFTEEMGRGTCEVMRQSKQSDMYNRLTFLYS